MSLEIISVGAALIDMVALVERYPEKDDEVYVTDLKIGCGGSAANFAVACARLGIKTGFVGKIGDDFLGKILREDFVKEGVNIDKIVLTKEVSTGLCYITVDPSGDRRMFAFSGAANILNPSDLDPKYIQQCSLLYLASLKNLDVLVAAAKIAEEKNIHVALNPGALIADQGYSKVKNLVEHVDIYISSKGEAYKLFQESDVYKLVDKILNIGIKKVALTLGSEGCLVADESNKILIKPYKVNVVDTTGAGDAFTAGFLMGIVKNFPLEVCGKLGCATAALCISKIGARNGLPTLSELKEFLAGRSEKWVLSFL